MLTEELKRALSANDLAWGNVQSYARQLAHSNSKLAELFMQEVRDGRNASDAIKLQIYRDDQLELARVQLQARINALD